MIGEFSSLPLPERSETEIFGDILCVTKWNWDYQQALDFQVTAQNFVRENKSKKIYIFCNHPHVFTLGTGNERGDDTLIDFNEAEQTLLPFPLFKIRRGGGITFHYPGQWIFYPIVAINPKNNLQDLMGWMLKQVADVLREEFKVTNILSAKKLLGVWVGRNKIASIGLGANRFVTEHGLALNLQSDKKMFAELKKIHPCGLTATTYIDLESINHKADNIEKFHQAFLASLFR